jgi:hypothetical protein
MSLSLFNQLLMPFLLVLLYRFLRHLSADRHRCITATLMASVASLAFPYAKHYWAEPLQTALILIALLQIPKIRGENPRASVWLLLSAALAYGVLVKYETIVPTAIVIPVAMFFRRPRSVREVVAFVGPWVGVSLIAGLYNIWRFGSILDFGYGELLTASTAVTDHGMVAATTLQGAEGWLRRAYVQLLSPGKGLFVYVPLTALAVAGTASKRAPFVTRVGFVCGYALLVFYTILDRSSTWCWGPRYLFPTMILLWPGLMLLTGRTVVKAAVGILTVLGIAVALLGVSVNFHDAIEEIKTEEGYDGWEWVEHVHSEARLSPLVWHARLVYPYLVATVRAGMEEPERKLPPVAVRHRRIDIVWFSLWAGGITGAVLMVPFVLLIEAYRRIRFALREAS